MEHNPYQQLKQIGFTINRLRFDAGLDQRPAETRRAFETLVRNVRAAQDILKDYELSSFEQDTLMQAKLLPRAVKALEKLRASLLRASEFDLIGTVDVAQISAELDELVERLH